MIIGISGKLYSGKDTFANLLTDCFSNYNISFSKKSFAYKLKRMGAYLTNTPEKWWFTQEGKQAFLPEWDMTVGEFQQKLGTEGLRKGVHQDGWVISLMSEYTYKEMWIVTDVRFLNEAEAIRDRQGILIRINGDPTGKRKLSKRDLNHISETSLDDYTHFDFIVDNSSSLSVLQMQAENIVLHLLQTRKI